jgi:hypothetical protein
MKILVDIYCIYPSESSIAAAKITRMSDEETHPRFSNAPSTNNTVEIKGRGPYTCCGALMFTEYCKIRVQSSVGGSENQENLHLHQTFLRYEEKL